MEDICDVEEDSLRNLYLIRRKNTGDKPVLMLDAHSDEVGFMVHSIRPTGTLRVVPLGAFALQRFSIRCSSRSVIRFLRSCFPVYSIPCPPRSVKKNTGKSKVVMPFSL